MTVLVCLDTDTGWITRWKDRVCTHIGGLHNGARAEEIIENFRTEPPKSLKRT